MKRIAIVATLLLGLGAGAEDRVTLEGSAIIGNRELPKVLYIAPWKQPRPGELHGPSGMDELMEDALAPVDRSEFRRELRFREQARRAAGP